MTAGFILIGVTCAILFPLVFKIGWQECDLCSRYDFDKGSRWTTLGRALRQRAKERDRAIAKYVSMGLPYDKAKTLVDRERNADADALFAELSR